MINKQAEQSVLGAIMLDPDGWGKIQGRVAESDFFHLEHRRIYASIAANAAEDKPLDPVTIASNMEQELFAYVIELSKECPSAANIEAYADLVREEAQKRSLSEILRTSLETIAHTKPLDAIAAITSEIESISHQNIGTGRTFHEVLKIGLDAIEEAKMMANNGCVSGVPCGIPMLDRWLSGFRKGKLYIVAARPSVGKTAFTLQSALHAAKFGYAGGILSLEMADDELATRSFANQYQVNGTALSYGNDKAIAQLTNKIVEKNIKNYPLYIDTDTYSLNGIVARANEWKRKYDIKSLVVDHAGLVLAEGDNKNERVGNVSRTLKMLAKKLDIPVILVSQLNRELEKTGRRPMLADLRDSGNLEQDADVVIFLHTDPQNNGKDVIPIEFGIAKHRGGKKGWMPPVFQFIGATQTIQEVGNA